MRRVLTWSLFASALALVVAAAVDGLRSDDSEESVITTTPLGSQSALIERCERSQLRLRIEVLAGTPAAALQHVRGAACEPENLRIAIAIAEGRGKVLGPRGAFSRPSLPNSQQIVEFRYSPACDERGPFIASVRAGPYTARRRIPVLRCGL